MVNQLAGGSLQAPASEFRNATTDSEVLTAWRSLLRQVAQLATPLVDALAVAMSTRLMRPGSSQVSDAVVDAACGSLG